MKIYSCGYIYYLIPFLGKRKPQFHFCLKSCRIKHAYIMHRCKKIHRENPEKGKYYRLICVLYILCMQTFNILYCKFVCVHVPCTCLNIDNVDLWKQRAYRSKSLFFLMISDSTASSSFLGSGCFL